MKGNLDEGRNFQPQVWKQVWTCLGNVTEVRKNRQQYKQCMLSGGHRSLFHPNWEGKRNHPVFTTEDDQ